MMMHTSRFFRPVSAGILAAVGTLSCSAAPTTSAPDQTGASTVHHDDVMLADKSDATMPDMGAMLPDTGNTTMPAAGDVTSPVMEDAMLPATGSAMLPTADAMLPQKGDGKMPGKGKDHIVKFEMVRSTATMNAGCLPKAHASVRIEPQGPVEVMTVDVSGLPSNAEFDFFVIQVPDSPFGLAWYQGDIETDGDGSGHAQFIGRFSIETFIVATGIAPAPVVHDQPPFPDANTNPQTAPVHTFHLGLWFNSPAEAVAAGCSGGETPFNGDHTAGVQVLSTRNFAPDQGPLRQVE